MFELGLLWLLIWVAKNAAMDVTYAVKGAPNPRYEIKAAKAKAAGRQPSTPPRYGSRDWCVDLWSDALAAQTERRRAKAAENNTAVKAADLRTATDQALAVAAPAPATQPTPAEVHPAPEKPTPEPTPDLPQPEPAPVSTPANVIPLRIVHNATKEFEMTKPVNSELIGLDQAIAYATSLEEFATDHGTAKNDGYGGFLVKSKVTGVGLTSGKEMQEALDNLAAMAAAHLAELNKHKTVQEAYDAVPDAGDKDYMTQGR